MSISVDIADAIVADLNSGSFSLPFTAQRHFMPDYELAELADLQVTVVPKAVEVSTFSRTIHKFDAQVDIGIQKKIDGDIDQQLPGLMDLVQEIADYLCKRQLTSLPQANWVGVRNDPIYAPQHLAEKRTFTSILTITYRIAR